MSDISVEKKMQLIQQVRSQYNRNQYDLMNREQILYGSVSSGRLRTEESVIPDPEGEAPAGVSTFRLRLLAAVVLLAAVIALDMTGSTLFGIPASGIFECISQDFDPGDLDFAKELTLPQRE